MAVLFSSTFYGVTHSLHNEVQMLLNVIPVKLCTVEPRLSGSLKTNTNFTILLLRMMLHGSRKLEFFKGVKILKMPQVLLRIGGWRIQVKGQSRVTAFIDDKGDTRTGSAPSRMS
ncbi:uncharacterized protein LOC143916667 [Arctopsyche grandis]|uniref:uncharacterized protein LOC143916667 n=1 Tax=Arctopsyche grandis TaxID=121162 RepID=UPI00406D8FF7